MDTQQTYSVGELTWYIKHKLESDNILRDVAVSGEISNLTRHGSGHVYFTLKEEQASLSCVMFRGNAARYQHNLPRHGDKVTLRGQISVYPPHGKYQMIVRAFQKAGQGDLHQRFLQLRDRLRAEGLFDEAHKQAIPAFPKRIGIVTSPTGAVLRDIINTIRRRYPHVDLVLAPSKVQGDDAADQLVAALELLNRQADIDVILLARGGGSLEDLWCFNEEAVARAIHASAIPVIAGIGHETDTTIADFAADLRAATPTAAAEQAVPDAADLYAYLDNAARQMQHSLQYFVDMRRQLLDDYSFRLRTAIVQQADFQRQVVDDYARRLREALQQTFDHARNRLNLMEVELHNLDERKVLARGYTVTTLDGQRIPSAVDIAEGATIVTHFVDGKATSTVETTETTEADGTGTK